MHLLSKLAERIVIEITDMTKEEAIVVNEAGIIVAATEQSRVGRFHEGAKHAITQKQMLIITEKDMVRLEGVKPGINLPIMFRNEVIGVIGITGAPEKIIGFGEWVKRMTELMIQEADASERLEAKYQGLESFVYGLLHTEQPTSADYEQGSILGIELEVDRCCVLIEVKTEERLVQADPSVEREILRRLREYFPNEREDFIVRWGTMRFLLLKAVHEHHRKQLATVLQRCKQMLEKKRQAAIEIWRRHDRTPFNGKKKLSSG